MVTSNDRWTCPDCDRTYLLGAAQGPAADRLAALQKAHAAEHLRTSRPQVPAQPEPRSDGGGAHRWSPWSLLG
jgi:hypothetical protein